MAHERADSEIYTFRFRSRTGSQLFVCGNARLTGQFSASTVDFNMNIYIYIHIHLLTGDLYGSDRSCNLERVSLAYVHKYR